MNSQLLSLQTNSNGPIVIPGTEFVGPAERWRILGYRIVISRGAGWNDDAVHRFIAEIQDAERRMLVRYAEFLPGYTAAEAAMTPNPTPWVDLGDGIVGTVGGPLYLAQTNPASTIRNSGQFYGVELLARVEPKDWECTP